jgi:hypothetical protein
MFSVKIVEIFHIWLITNTVHTNVLHFIWISVRHCRPTCIWIGHFHSAARSLCTDRPWCKHQRQHRDISQEWKWPIHVVHAHPMYNVRPDSLSIVGETSYGTRVGFIESDIVIIIYLFKSEEKVCICPGNQLPIVLPPFTWTHFTYTRNQQSLQSWAINLCSRWPHYVQPCLQSLLTWMTASNSLWSVQNFSYLFIFHLAFRVCLC